VYNDREKREQAGVSLSWWSWRPGIRPGRALLIGIPLALVGVFFIVAGIYSVISILIDSNSPPTRVPGEVTGYTSSILDNQTHLSISLQRNGRSATVTPAITAEEQRVIHRGDAVTLDFSPHLGYLYALEDHGQRYTLPGGSPLDNLFGSIALTLVGLLFFPYPFLLAVWGWYDLRQPAVTLRGRVVGLRTSQRTPLARQRRATHPGLTPRLRRAWHGMALETPATASQQDIVTFAIGEEQHKALSEGQDIEVLYSPHLHYVYAIRPVSSDPPLSDSRQEQAR
jgi:hypothetical protein